VLWVGVIEMPPRNVLEKLAERLELAGRACGFPPEKRSFRPHLTLARAARQGRAEWPGDYEARVGGFVEVKRVSLFLSELHPSGARYTALESFELEGDRERR
jgi:2'-5' RNA ligase